VSEKAVVNFSKACGLGKIRHRKKEKAGGFLAKPEGFLSGTDLFF
jgi:hypothetical protein